MTVKNFAHISNGVVDNIIIAEQSVIDSFPNANEYVEFFSDANGEQSKRYNSARIGRSYDASADAFLTAQPFASWTQDSNYQWQPPTAKPENTATHYYSWDEISLSWVQHSEE